MAKLLVKYNQTDGFKDTGFSDVPKDHWAYDAISLACSKGIMAGYADNSFRPQKNVQKYEAILMMMNFLKVF